MNRPRTLVGSAVPGGGAGAGAAPSVSSAVGAGPGLTIPAIRFAITDRNTYRPVRTALTLIDEIRRRHLADFRWTGSLDRLAGTDRVRLAIEAGTLPALLDEWDRAAAAFQRETLLLRLYQ